MVVRDSQIHCTRIRRTHATPDRVRADSSIMFLHGRLECLFTGPDFDRKGRAVALFELPEELLDVFHGPHRGEDACS